MAIVQDLMPKTIRPQTKRALRKSWQCATHKNMKTAFDYFNATQEATHPKASACLADDHDKQRTLYNCPATKKKYLKQTNTIDTTFGIIRLTKVRTTGCIAFDLTLRLMFKFGERARDSRRRLSGFAYLTSVI